MPQERSYIAIDLKSFYASVECVERKLNPLTTNLVVADSSRTDKTICLAVSPSLKAYGISGRARLFEVVQRVREINTQRTFNTPDYKLKGKSTHDPHLQEHPDWALDYITATPRMALYIQYSARIFDIYLKHVAAEDIHVYSCDEVFIDATTYLPNLHITAREFAMRMIKDVLRETGITATAGIGTNLYLCKVAMDIIAKHSPADEDGVRIAELDEMSYRQLLWDHQPLTDFWRVGHGIAQKLASIGVYTMGQLARCSLQKDELLYKMFGVNAELLIDHAWGWEPCTMNYIKAYRPEVNSLSSGQVLTSAYTFDKARTVVHEMADACAMNLLDKHLVTDQIVLDIGYDMESLTNPDIRTRYQGEIRLDYYGRPVPKHAHGTQRLQEHTSSSQIIRKTVLDIFDRVVNPDLLVRRINITTNRVITERAARILQERKPLQLDLFADYEALAKEREEKEKKDAKERRMQDAMLKIQKQFGKNAILRGTSYAEGATARERNQQIGGHRA